MIDQPDSKLNGAVMLSIAIVDAFNDKSLNANGWNPHSPFFSLYPARFVYSRATSIKSLPDFTFLYAAFAALSVNV